LNISYLRAFLVAIKNNLSALYVNDGQAINWDGYGEIYPKIGDVSGAIALSPHDVNVKGFDLSNYPLSYVTKYITQLEIKLTGDQGFDDLALIYDHHEFVLNHLLKEVRVNGISTTVEGILINKACLGLKIVSQQVGVSPYQDKLIRLRSLINFEWEYLI
jgi:hypothetical protein